MKLVGRLKGDSPSLKVMEIALYGFALICAAFMIAVAGQARGASQESEQIVVQAHPASTRPVGNTALWRLEIAAVNLSVPVYENYDAGTLRLAVGHVPGTALPGGLGNLVIAGHRDTFFRPLRSVKGGMQITVVAPTGRWRYAVDRTEIVSPDQVRVLDIGDRPELTLITCYPFDFIGSAPQRFIVHAHLLSLEPS